MRIRFTLPAIVGLVLAGCYTLKPARSATPEVGRQVAFDINDAGRIALGGTMGPEISRIEGRLLRKDQADYLVAVTAVQLLRGGEQIWRGEEVRISPEYIGSTYERRFSRGRTIAAGAVVVGGLVALVISRDLFGLGDDGPDPVKPDTVQTRIKRP